MPAENLIYLADTRYAPYGQRSGTFIESRVNAIADFLVNQSVKAIVVACNTATAAGVHLLRSKLQIPIIGLEPALKPAAEFSTKEKVGVLATQSTLESQKYQTLRSRFLAQVDIIEKASPLFVELVETAPKIEQDQLDLIAVELAPFIEAKVDSLVLGCTHYPFLTDAIQKIMGPEVTLFESAMPVAREVKRRLEGQLNESEAPGTITYYSSAPEQARARFERLLGHTVDLCHFRE